MYDVLIIGGGPAGMTAAIYCSRYKLKCGVIGSRTRRMMQDAHAVDIYPSFRSISGIELSKRFIEHMKKFSVEAIEEEVVGIKKDKDFVVTDKNDKKYRAKSLILAMGTEKRRLNVPGEEKYIGKGVSYCYTCDGPFFKDKIVGIVGGCNSAAMAALLLSDYAKKVYVIYRGECIRADPICVEAVTKKKNVTIINKSNVVRINGNRFVESVDLDTGKNIKLDGLFVEIGLIPLVSLVKSMGIKLEGEHIAVDKEHKTNIEGVFAAGDVTNASELKQILVSASQGAIAAASAHKYIRKK